MLETVEDARLEAVVGEACRPVVVLVVLRVGDLRVRRTARTPVRELGIVGGRRFLVDDEPWPAGAVECETNREGANRKAVAVRDVGAVLHELARNRRAAERREHGTGRRADATGPHAMMS